MESMGIDGDRWESQTLFKHVLARPMHERQRKTGDKGQ